LPSQFCDLLRAHSSLAVAGDRGTCVRRVKRDDETCVVTRECHQSYECTDGTCTVLDQFNHQTAPR
jgi:hypothetical protein